ncbi:TetR/AcrR family transcriptional regulator [Paenibacillus antri]|uniref:TetR/AcrR family transcriptional regulator n=1 Tax=Paenibacillus antri TaxID=2582848 RepID=A0A5R9G6P9_9BACL|nr:TetR/AcrR family transcriptional regulator [Paenibacillus antri]TLS48644.1 TetR/AcrR family transcriptional regulator [Paenibacillus antri]
MDKKTLILNSAVTLFAQRGYHQTTIQDIADEAGIAKGGIYFYFKSKEELLLSVVSEYYDRLFNQTVDTANRYLHAPKEGLVQQVMNHFQDAGSHSNMIALFTRGQIDVNAEVRSVLLDMRGKFLVWFRDQVIAVYGPRIEPYAFDLAALLTSLVREYMSFILVNGAALPVRGLGEAIVARVDDAARGVIRSQEPPMLTTAFMKTVLPTLDIREGADASRQLSRAIDALVARIGAEVDADEDATTARQAADVMKEEAAKPKPRRVVLEGMLTLLERMGGDATAGKELEEARRLVATFES